MDDNIIKQEIFSGSATSKDRISRHKKKAPKDAPLAYNVHKPIWLSVSESAKLGGVTGKTIRRALGAGKLRYKIIKNRYLIDLRSVIRFLHTNKKLKNKLRYSGIGQYINKWRE